MAGVFRSEWTKFYSYPLCFAGVIGSLITAPLFLLLTDNLSAVAELSVQDAVSQCLRVLFLAQAGMVIAAVGFFGQEYEQSCLRTTFLAIPNRMKAITVKWIVLTTVAVLSGILTCLLSLAAGIVLYDYNAAFRLAAEFMPCAALALVSWVQIAWISAALSMLTKTLIAPIAIMLPLIFNLSQLLYTFFKPAKFLPDLAAFNLFLIPKTASFLDILPGIIVQFIWVLLLGAAAVFLAIQRDVR